MSSLKLNRCYQDDECVLDNACPLFSEDGCLMDGEEAEVAKTEKERQEAFVKAVDDSRKMISALQKVFTEMASTLMKVAIMVEETYAKKQGEDLPEDSERPSGDE